MGKKRYVIGYKKNLGLRAQSIAEQFEGQVEYEFKTLPNRVIVSVPDRALKALHNNPNIEFIEEDQEFDNVDPMAQSTAEWGINATQVQNFWNAGFTGQGVIVSVHDSGCSPHEDLQGAIIDSYNSYSPPSPIITDEASHGTCTHGIIGARNNNLGYVGYAYDCKMYNVKHSYNGFGSPLTVAMGIDWALSRNPRPHIMCLNVQLSMGSTTLHDSVKAAHQAGVLLVGAAGNWAQDSAWSDMAYPAKYPEVLAVGAVTSNLNRASYSNTGPNLDVVCTTDMMAPMADNSVSVSSKYKYFSGTSCATPSCAGLLAVLKSAYPNYTNVQLKNKLLEGVQDLGTPGRDDEYGHGFVRLLPNMLPTAPTVPIAPTLSGTPGDGKVVLNWNAVSGATSFDVYMNGLKYQSTTLTNYTIPNLTNGSSYSFYVKAVNSAGSSPNSNTVNVTPTTGGAKPTNVTLSVTPSIYSCTLNYSATGATSYDIYRNGSLIVSGRTTTSYTDTGLAANTSYTYYIIARNTFGSSQSSSVTQKTEGGTAPGTCSLTVGSPTTSSLTLSYSAPGATSYDIYRGSTKIQAGRTAISYTDTGLAANNTYTYYVIARNDYGTTTSTNKQGTTLPNSGPNPVTISEGFEGTKYAFTFTGDWADSKTEASTGTWSRKSKAITHKETSTMQFTENIPSNYAQTPTLKFDYFVSSEANYDYLEVLVEGVSKLKASGETGWVKDYSVTLGTGNQTVTFNYVKDGSTSKGQDCAYVDNIRVSY
ncbi:S8 family serine peptidase [Brevibacillus reuszeri]|uniref:S8 family serine peptidase n=1 Tax=Brevibacillus reuszeri TaxID=54915 RepID=UPI000CCC9926|nr:S8 family serine peptidase [Brevibacillus reuszeri]